MDGHIERKRAYAKICPMKKALLSFSLLPLLLSCSAGGDFSSYSYGELNTAPFSSSQEEGYRYISEYKAVSSKDESFLSYRDMLQKEVDGSERSYYLPSTGVQKLLVIPVDFSDYPASSLSSDALSHINRAFFGTDSDSFFSLASFYEQSSYGRLQIKGKVASSWFRASSPSTSYETTSIYEQKRYISSLYKEALEWYDKTYPDDSSANYAFYVDGSPIVPVFFVYSRPYEGMGENKIGRSSFYWAYTINSPAPICFASYHMIDDGGTSRTFIHEAGHLFGLKDYYDDLCSEDVAEISPLGRADMMDASLGDHNPFSKLLLDWTRPIEVTSSCSISLRPFSLSGECLLLAPDWKGSLYEEYLLVCFYTPFGLNHYDGRKDASPSNALPSSPGIMVYKVNAKLVTYLKNLPTGDYLPDGSVSSKGKKVDFACSNSLSSLSSYKKALIQLLDHSSSSEALTPYFVASSSSRQEGDVSYRDVLFKKGSSLSDIKDLTWPNGSKLSLDFKVDAVSATYATIAFAL